MLTRKMIIVMCLVGLAFLPNLAEAVYDPSPGQENGTEEPQYVPGEIIVKFKRAVADSLAAQLAEKRAVAAIELSASLDSLNSKYQVKGIKPIFKNFKAQRARLKNLLAKPENELTAKERRLVRRQKRAPEGAKVPELDRIYKIELGPDQLAPQAAAEYSQNPDVEYAELNGIVRALATPADFLYPIQWSLNNIAQRYPYTQPGTEDADIDAPEAWEISTGDPSLVVAVIDTGVDYTHRDLASNMWVNEVELNGTPGEDDDGNGYKDDIYGYDFYNDDGDPSDDMGHGTHCAGTIAAQGDNSYDVVGVCWNAKVMALKFISEFDYGEGDDAAEATYYAVNNGAEILSNSWGGGPYSQTLQDAIDYAYYNGVAFVAAAGNFGNDTPFYPAAMDNVLSVAATNSVDGKASFSNYGDWVDIAAPGKDILSLRATGTSMPYVYDDYTTVLSGTSMACPHVAGACALLLSVDPDLKLDLDQLYGILMQTGDPIADGICSSDARLNVFKALHQAVPSEGRVFFRQEYYNCSSEIEIWLLDGDLVGQSSYDVTVMTFGGDYETVTLAVDSELNWLFTGTIMSSDAPVVPNNGTVEVSDGDQMGVDYMDGPVYRYDFADVDCVAPVISSVELSNTDCQEPHVAVTTDVPTRVEVLCGTTCNDPEAFVRDDYIILKTDHEVILNGVQPYTEHFVVVKAYDRAGNLTVDDCRNFTTNGPIDIYVPSEYPTIEAGIDRAIENCWGGTTVWLADGTYTGNGNRDIIIVYPAVSLAIKSENGPETCIIDCEGSQAEPHRGFVFHGNGSPPFNIRKLNVSLDGVTIKNAYGTGYGSAIMGAAADMNIEVSNCKLLNNTSTGSGGAVGLVVPANSSMTIRNCTMVGNTSGALGGAVGVNGAHVPIVIQDCTLSDNHGAFGGAIGIGESVSPVVVASCVIQGNTSDTDGGAVALQGAALDLTDSLLAGNTTDGCGGGVYAHGSYSIAVTDCTLSGNHAGGWYGGAIYLDGCAGSTITNSILKGNSCDNSGGAIGCVLTSPDISNCQISGNSAVGHGAGIYAHYYSSPTISNCSVVDNVCTLGNGGGVDCAGESEATIQNCILWGNVAPLGPQISLRSPEGHGAEVGVSYSDVQGGQSQVYVDPGSVLNWGLGNIDADPLFVPASGDYHLSSALSPCVNAGDPTGDYTGEKDMDGEPRVMAGRVDMGADEFSGIFNLDQEEWYASIQDAIDDAGPTETIEVGPGTYSEAIDFKGKAITVRSAAPGDWAVVASTIIDATGSGAGVNFVTSEGSDSVLSGLTIKGAASGIMCGHDVTCVIDKCIIKDNTVCGIRCWGGSPTVQNCKIEYNGTFGVYVINGDPTILSNWIYDSGTGVFCAGPTTDATVRNNTIVDSTTGISCVSGASATVSNCILWGNGTQLTGGCTVTYSCVQGDPLPPGDGNINSNPLFVDHAADDFHLSSGSPCRNSGVPGENYIGEKDIDNESRVMEERVDMGGDEYNPD